MLALPSISVVAETPDLNADAINIVVTVPTFRRPEQLLATLESIRAQRNDLRIAIIVMENDAEGRAGAEAAASLFLEGHFQGMVIIAHQRGNCCAYNAGWRAALQSFGNARHIAVIDDDEIADPDWLNSMSAAAFIHGADIVGGPQVPIFARLDADGWAEHPVFAPPYRTSGQVPALYSSGNLFIARRVLETMEQPFLDLKFNFMGGGDSDFLSRASQRGFTLAWAADAIVREAVPARRLESDWIRARSLRNGVISTLVEKKRRAGTPFANARVFLKSLALLAASPLRGVSRLIKTGSLSVGLYPVYVAAGRVMAEFGYANEQYRQPEKN